MESLLLDKIDQPSDLKKLNAQQVEKLCAEIRHFMLENISKTGGHLASNLGTVELTVALHRVLETPKDKIVFDVGHQCYTHKLLTGRRKQFDHLRQLDGISGFPNPHESVHDAFIAGHGNTALSLAIGMAWAKKIKREPGLVVAVIGDGAFTGGMVYEGMNNIGGLDNLLVILNDNKMSISKNVGALARYLTHLRTTTAYYDAKDNVRSFLDGVPVIGTPMKKSLIGAKTLVRRAMYHSTMFEDMGIRYMGPIDGHNINQMCEALDTAKSISGPVLLHVNTIKGKGYDFAVDFAKIEKGAFVSEVDSSEITGQEELKVVVIQGNFNVQVPGNILYVSTKNVALIDKNTIAIAEGNAMDESLKEETQATESADVVQEFATETEELLEDEPSDATEDVDQMVFDFPAEEEAPKSEFTSVCTYIVYK